MSEENKNLFEENNNFDENDVTTPEKNLGNDADTIYFSEPSIDESQNYSNEFQSNKKIKRSISVKALIISLIAVCVASVMLTYTICSSLYQSLYAKAYDDANQNSHLGGNTVSTDISELDIIAQLINDNFYGEIDAEKLMQAAIEAYVKQTGDVYAAYYTQAELNAMLQEDLGKSVGVGVNIINDKINYKGSDISVLKVVNIVNDSPAEKNGLKLGDYIYAAIIDGNILTVDNLGYDEILNKLLGEIGTTASFIALRNNGEMLEEITFNIVREIITTRSVYFRVLNENLTDGKKIGVLKITNFD